MAQLAVQGRKTAEAGRIQAGLNELLREFGPGSARSLCTSVPTAPLPLHFLPAAFLGAKVKMLNKATALLHSHPQHPKAQRTAFGRLIKAPAQRGGPAGTPTGLS